jgi:hypothetical protein
MTALPPIAADATAVQACETFESAGWAQVGVGDWSWVLADPEDRWAARVTPFDPAYRLHAESCMSGGPNRWLPRMTTLIPLRQDGYIVVMERLWPAPEAAAEAFCAALAIGNDSGRVAPPDTPFQQADDGDLAELRIRLRALLTDGARRFRLWGGSDIRPGNVMIDDQGRLKLVDPVFIRGRAILDALQEGRRDRLTDFSRPQLEDFLTIPAFKPGEETQALRERLARLYDGPAG